MAILAMAAIAGSSWWMISQANTASMRTLMKKDADLQSKRVSDNLTGIIHRISELTTNSLITNALFDTSDKERYLIPFLNDIQYIHDIPIDILFTDFEGREIASNGNKSFSEQELNWLREKFPSGQEDSRVQLGEKGEELLAVEFIVISESVEGALLYRIKLGDLPLVGGAQLMHGKEPKLLLHDGDITTAVDLPSIYKHLNFTIHLSHESMDLETNWQPLWIFFILGVGVVVIVIILGLYLGRKLTKDLLKLESFARRITEKGFSEGASLEGASLEGASLEGASLEVTSLSQSINHMLERLKEEQEEVLSLNVNLEERVQQRTEELASYIQGIGQHAIISVGDLAGRITEANQRFCEISGYTRAELLGQDHRIVNSKTHPKEFFVQMWATINRGDIWRGEICNRAKDGQPYWVDSAIVPIKDSQRRIVRFISVRIDITERKRVEEEVLFLNANLEEQVQQLHNQQEELRQSNEEMEEKNKQLATQKSQVQHKNREIEASKLMLEEKAEQLALTSKYKSEFLSSMSHELRTPLNSLLILAQLLAENPEQNLSEQQTEYAKTIQAAGKDLLELINDILDLSKIESGTVVLDLQDISFADVGQQLERTFRHMAQSRDLGFSVELAPNLPPSFYTDSQRLQQVMKNLLSNALKFTEKGQVSVRIAPVESGWSVDHESLNRAQTVIGFYVTDTGIGLAPGKQKIIFEAFQQADTGTARKYGGTGLGLSISRELARLLGGELFLVESELGKGSTFAIYFPLHAPEFGQGSSSFTPESAPQERIHQPTALADDRAAITPGEHTLLIIEDDAVFAGILLRLARKKGFKGIVTARGDDGLKLASEFKPTAITLDLHLPDMDGWVVLERLKQNLDTRHIPVEIISGEDNRQRGLFHGAFEYLVKPVTTEALQKALVDVRKFAAREIKELLIIDGDAQQRNNMLELIGSSDVRIKMVVSGKEALAALKKKRYDCIVLDIHLPDISAADLLEAIQRINLKQDIPVIIYGINELPQQEQERIKALALKGIVKEVRTPERLLDETALFLHRVVSKLPEERRQMLEKLYLSADSLAGKKVLVVDDDVRNIFALTAVLERQKMVVFTAENGRAALEELDQNPDVDIVLMDIMMPEMDGYEAMRQIRQMKQFESLPMIAITAKAMKGDREACIEAGASDYLSKPVDPDQLLSLLRVWLYRQE